MEIAAVVLMTLFAVPVHTPVSDPVGNSVLARLTPPAAVASLLPAHTARLSTDSVADVAVYRAAPRGRTLVIVGAALFVAGLIADGDAGTIMLLAGAGIGGYGLYLMLGP